MTIEQIAKVCHEMNMALCLSVGDHSQLPWDEAPQHIKESAIDGVIKVLGNPDLAAGDSHRTWCEFKVSQGYVYGAVKDDVAKTHPSLIPFEQLSAIEQAKDYVFVQTVRSLAAYLD